MSESVTEDELLLKIRKLKIRNRDLLASHVRL